MYNKFDWINNPLYPALWVPSLFATETYFVYQLVQFMRSIPHDLDEMCIRDRPLPVCCVTKASSLPRRRPSSCFWSRWT